MIEVIAGTDRPNSNSLQIAQLVVEDFRAQNQPVGLIDLNQLDFKEVAGAGYRATQGTISNGVERVTKADGVVIVVPEYNGSFPGALKLFIDYWRYPDTFENRPMAFIGLGGRWGGLRPVEHLQQVCGYRNAYLFPNRVFISNIKDSFKGGQITDPLVADLLRIQSRDFIKFVKALKSESLDANSRRKT